MKEELLAVGTEVRVAETSQYYDAQGTNQSTGEIRIGKVLSNSESGDWKYHIGWSEFDTNQYRAIDIEEVITFTYEEINNKLKQELNLKQKPLITNKMKQETLFPSITEKFVFMNKTVNILNVGMLTNKNVVLYGPGGHGKSEITLDFLAEKGIDPYIITMGTGMTTDRLFGGLNIPTFEASGKIEYLVENSFMNYEYVIFEEMFDAPDFILEQLKDIISSGTFRNGTQIFPIKTKFIVCCTNRTRDEFSKNMSLKALMERFPLELNVIWDNYTEIAYNKLLETKFGEGNVDPIIPFLLQEYAVNGITISPRVAVTAYTVFEQCGPDALTFIAEFAKKPTLIADAIKKFEATIKFRELSDEISSIIEKLESNPMSSTNDKQAFKTNLAALQGRLIEVKGLTVTDDIAHMLAALTKAVNDKVKTFEKKQQIAQIIVEL